MFVTHAYLVNRFAYGSYSTVMHTGVYNEGFSQIQSQKKHNVRMHMEDLRLTVLYTCMHALYVKL